ncbi:MAG: cyclohexa-1,5-dienecarbonyl-CoA hydratase [Gammaproteobacteria bacterium]|nr:cyclohexa-1,5-dienecarbonyl-CoA hydratase [Gammaproteobacteria bacterium]MDH4254245.1 cyclohexa-1,5-dienecarbonyl-CoA hydratase [Gammaproteobacteria bacterium]MDH5310627.1 cyclohexa-1,5-dienecarbonyl-CoA hydratase [Gammaproteobacteria bacterium]
MTSPLRVWLEQQEALLRLRLSAPKPNLVDAAMIEALDAALAEHLDNPQLRAILIDAEGPSFSYGASVSEHLPGECRKMLTGLHALILRMVESPVTILVAVRGKCLGGGLELALAGHLLFIHPDSELGQPEIRLGVFAPAASCLLPELMAPQRALDLLVSGRTISGAEAVAAGLGVETVEDPEAAALAYFAKHLLSKSARSLRFAVQAARQDYAARIRKRIASVERLYLDELMATRDAVEGLEAFIEKRQAVWEHR